MVPDFRELPKSLSRHRYCNPEGGLVPSRFQQSRYEQVLHNEIIPEWEAVQVGSALAEWGEGVFMLSLSCQWLHSTWLSTHYTLCFYHSSCIQFQFLQTGCGVQGSAWGLQAPAKSTDRREPYLAWWAWTENGRGQDSEAAAAARHRSPAGTERLYMTSTCWIAHLVHGLMLCDTTLDILFVQAKSVSCWLVPCLIWLLLRFR